MKAKSGNNEFMYDWGMGKEAGGKGRRRETDGRTDGRTDADNSRATRLKWERERVCVCVREREMDIERVPNFLSMGSKQPSEEGGG